MIRCAKMSKADFQRRTLPPLSVPTPATPWPDQRPTNQKGRASEGAARAKQSQIKKRPISFQTRVRAGRRSKAWHCPQKHPSPHLEKNKDILTKVEKSSCHFLLNIHFSFSPRNAEYEWEHERTIEQVKGVIFTLCLVWSYWICVSNSIFDYYYRWAIRIAESIGFAVRPPLNII